MTAVYSLIAEEKADPRSDWRVAEMCRTLGVSRQGFHDWEARPPSNHQVTDRLLAAEIEAIWECSARTYGAPRVHAWLRRQGYRVARKRVARIMREHDWVGISGRRRVRTTIVDRSATAADDLVARNFDPVAPDVTWAGDITYIPTGEGWLFLATVIDLFSRRIIGWGVADHLRTPLVSAALDMAVATRGGHVDGV
ncbi:MAG: IS3 family transposase, partial [Micromonosporaceae bacterium]